MTRKQKQAAKRVIAKDCAIRHRLIDKSGKTCAVGALALAAGIESNELRQHGFGKTEISDKVDSAFGINWSIRAMIVYENDEPKTVKARRKAVLAYLDSLPTTD